MDWADKVIRPSVYALSTYFERSGYVTHETIHEMLKKS
jgi:hypothetical protein